jgi:hypothetical protein
LTYHAYNSVRFLLAIQENNGEGKGADLHLLLLRREIAIIERILSQSCVLKHLAPVNMHRQYQYGVVAERITYSSSAEHSTQSSKTMKPVLFTTAKCEACATGVLTHKLSTIKLNLLRLHVNKGREWLCNEYLETTANPIAHWHTRFTYSPCPPTRFVDHAVSLMQKGVAQDEAIREVCVAWSVWASVLQ